MIDWINLAGNALWILGCSLGLASLSYARWQALEKKVKLRQAFGSPGVQSSLHGAGMLFCAGIAVTAGSVLLAILWGLVGVGILAHLVLYKRGVP